MLKLFFSSSFSCVMSVTARINPSNFTPPSSTFETFSLKHFWSFFTIKSLEFSGLFLIFSKLFSSPSPCAAATSSSNFAP